MTEYCRNYVRETDYHRYLLSFFVPRRIRGDALAILAFNAELQSIPARIHDPVAGLIRLQWWRDEIGKIYAGTPHAASPVLSAMATTIQAHNIPHTLCESLCACYEDILRGVSRDPDDALYALYGSLSMTEKEKNRFSKRLHLHDIMDDHTPFRALRLWLGV